MALYGARYDLHKKGVDDRDCFNLKIRIVVVRRELTQELLMKRVVKHRHRPEGVMCYVPKLVRRRGELWSNGRVMVLWIGIAVIVCQMGQQDRMVVEEGLRVGKDLGEYADKDSGGGTRLWTYSSK